MPDVYYRTGQAAKQLGVSSYHVRRLCEAGAIAAELSEGQQWRIPATEIEQLKNNGVPPVPRRLEEERAAEPPAEDVPEGLYANPSEAVIGAAEEVKIVESRLRKRRLEREAEEVEDWFRDRDRQNAAEEAAERQRIEAAAAQRRREMWLHSWTQQALDSLPRGTPREIELDVHAAVQQALAGSQASQPDAITRRLVNAAVAKALRPWQRRGEVQRAIQAAVNQLPSEVQYRSEWAALKQRACEAAAQAAGRVREDGAYSEMEAAAIVAVQPMILEHRHGEICRRLMVWTYVPGSTSEEGDHRTAGRHERAADGTRQARRHSVLDRDGRAEFRAL